MVEYESPLADIRITRAPRASSAQIHCARAVELGSFIGRQSQRHITVTQYRCLTQSVRPLVLIVTELLMQRAKPSQRR